MSYSWRILLSCLAFTAVYLIALQFEALVTGIAMLGGIAFAGVAMHLGLSKKNSRDDDAFGFVAFTAMAFFCGAIAGYYVGTRAMVGLNLLFLCAGTVGFGLVGDKIAYAIRSQMVGGWQDDSITAGSVGVKMVLSIAAISFFVYHHPLTIPESVQVYYNRGNPADMFVVGQLSGLAGQLVSTDSAMGVHALWSLFPTALIGWLLVDLAKAAISELRLIR